MCARETAKDSELALMGTLALACHWVNSPTQPISPSLSRYVRTILANHQGLNLAYTKYHAIIHIYRLFK